MGLFDKFKKKRSNDIEIRANDSLTDTAVKLAKSGVMSVPKDNNHNTFGQTLD